MGRAWYGIILLHIFFLRPIHARLATATEDPAHAKAEAERAEQLKRAEGVPDLVGKMWGRQVTSRIDSDDPTRGADIQRSLETIAADNANGPACKSRTENDPGPQTLASLGDATKSPVEGLQDSITSLTGKWDEANKPAAGTAGSATSTSGTTATTGSTGATGATGTNGATPPAAAPTAAEAEAAAAAAAAQAKVKNEIISATKDLQTKLAGYDEKIQHELTQLCPSDVAGEKGAALAKSLDGYFKMRAGADKLLSSTGLLAGKKPGSGDGEGGAGPGGGDDEEGGDDEKQSGMGMPFGGPMGGMGGGQGGQGSSSSSSSSNSSSNSKPASMKIEGMKLGELSLETGFGALSSQVTATIQSAWKSLSEKASQSAQKWEPFYRSLASVPTAATIVGVGASTTNSAPVASPSATLTNAATGNH